MTPIIRASAVASMSEKNTIIYWRTASIFSNISPDKNFVPCS